MCGILGSIFPKNRLCENKFEQALDCLKHRGPDASGIWSDEAQGIILGHRRLAILDLSEKAAQPMVSADGQWVLTFNGEIYNFQELRLLLEKAGHEFKSNSDTEVLLYAWMEWGTGALSKLEGMFAFGLYNLKHKQLILARDAAGEKPLYYYNDARGFAFASELKALLALPDMPKEVDALGLDWLLATGTIPATNCILKGYQKLHPGHFLVYDLKTQSMEVSSYWKLPIHDVKAKDVNEFELINELDRLIYQSISRQLVADVPVGVLLSGGLDSSLVTAYSARIQKRIHTYTVSFPGYGLSDEAPFAREVANFFGTVHTEIPVEAPEPEILETLAAQFCEPMTDPSIIPTYLLSKAIREHCTVALGGDGGDELFGGYQRYSQWIKMKNNWGNVPIALRSTIAAASSLLPDGFRGKHYLKALATNFNREVPLADPLFQYKDRSHLLAIVNHQPYDLYELKRSFLESNSSDFADRAMRYDFNTYLPDDILVKVDRTSMLASLEVRAPLLDKQIVDFSFSKLPTSLKIRGGNRKIILKKLAQRYLPEQFDVNRKQGFVPPLERWMLQTKWTNYIEEHLFGCGLFNEKYLHSLLNGQKQGRYNKRRIFTLLMFERWCTHFNISI